MVPHLFRIPIRTAWKPLFQPVLTVARNSKSDTPTETEMAKAFELLSEVLGYHQSGVLGSKMANFGDYHFEQGDDVLHSSLRIHALRSNRANKSTSLWINLIDTKVDTTIYKGR